MREVKIIISIERLNILLCKLVSKITKNPKNRPILQKTQKNYKKPKIDKSCEFLYAIVEKTIKETLPSELNYLTSFDRASYEINEIVAMPNNMIKSLIGFILQNGGKLSKKKKSKYF